MERHKPADGQAVCVSIDPPLAEKPSSAQEWRALDAALVERARFDPRQATIVESRFFGEVAALLDVSEATVMRDRRAANAWLGQRLRR